MKQRSGKRILAGLLIIVLVMTSFMWDFGKGNVVKADEGTATEKTKAVSDEIVFADVTTDELTQFSSTEFKNNNGWKVNSDAKNQLVSKHWTIDDDGVLRSNVTAGNFYALYYDDTYTNFRVSVEIEPGATHKGIIMGNQDIYPGTGTAGAVRIYCESGKIYIRGAIKEGSGITSFDYTPSKAFVLNIRVQNGKIVVWVDGVNGDTPLTATTADTFPTGEKTVGLWSKYTTGTGDNGGFRSFEIFDLDVEGYYDFEGITTAQLSSMPFTSKNNSGTPDEPVSESWSWANGQGLQTLNDGNIHALYYNQTYRNFEVSTEINRGYMKGIVFGAQNVSPATDATDAVRVYFDQGKMYIRGAIDMNSVPEGNKNETGTIAQFAAVPSANFTLHVKLVDRILTVWWDGCDEVLSVRVKDTYPLGSVHVGLYAKTDTSTNTGGFKFFEIESLDNENYIDFEKCVNGETDLSLPQFSSSMFTNTSSNTVTEESIVSEQWQWNDTTGLQPKDTINFHVLYYNDSFTNFTASAEIYRGNHKGIILGDKNTWAEGNTTSFTNAIRVYYDSTTKNIIVRGAIDVSGDNLKGGAIYNTTMAKLSQTPSEKFTLNVRVQDRILSVWLDGSEDEVLSVKVRENFPAAASVGLLIRNQTNDIVGGFQSFEVEKLDDEAIAFKNTSVDNLTQFTSTKFQSSAVVTQDQTAATHGWTIANDVLKSSKADNSYYAMYYEMTYKNFEMSTEIVTNTADKGIVFGAKNIYPNSGNAAVRVYYGGNDLIYVRGAIDTDTVVGGTYSGTAGTVQFPYASAGEFILNVKVEDGLITVGVEGEDTILTVKTSSDYPIGDVAIGLWSNRFGKDGGFKSFTINEISSNIQEYKAVEFASHRQLDENGASAYTAPEKDGYVFSGWFYDDEATENVENTAQTVNQRVFAKFVPEKVLTVKAQISSNLGDANGDNDKSGDIRFVTTVDSLQYSKVGFKISYDKGEGAGEQSIERYSAKVYTKLYAVGNIYEDDKEYVPTDFSHESKYFKAFVFKGVTAPYYDMDFNVTSVWITLDGTTVNGETVVKKIDDKRVISSVYVSNVGSDENKGTAQSPYLTLNHAIDKVVDGGTVYVMDKITCAPNSNTTYFLGGDASANAAETEGETVTISGAEGTNAAMLDFSSCQHLRLDENVILKDIQVSWPQTRVFAEGYEFTVEESVVQKDESSEPYVIGGSHSYHVDRTDLTLNAGTYKYIIGGAVRQTVGETHVTVGGSVNSNMVTTGDEYHEHTRCVFGGGWSDGNADTSVTGNTYVTINSGAKFNYVFGGGYVASGNYASIVEGETHVEFAGMAYGVYGGSCAHATVGRVDNGNTHVIIKGGEVHQVFGGSEESAMSGNTTDVQLLGGKILRRVYGGCYNNCNVDFLSATWTSSHSITGNTNITINSNVTFNLSDTDNGVLAGSRYKETFQDEVGTIIFIDDTYGDGTLWNRVLGRQNYTSYLGNPNPYNYLIDASAGGKVTVSSDVLRVELDSDYKDVTVTCDNGTVTDNGDGTYTLPTVDKDSSVKIKIQFSK